MPTAPPAPQVDMSPDIADPERLPRRPPVQPASVGIDREDPALVTVAVIAAGATLDDPGGAAILDSRTGAPLGWQPMAEGEETPRGLRLTFPSIPVGDHHAVLAASPDRARYSYKTRTALVVVPGEDSPPTVLDARSQDVIVRPVLQGRPQDSLPPIFRLSRADDPHWHPGMRAADVRADPMTVPRADGSLHLAGLGPGRYALTPLDGNYMPYEFTVPGPARLTATFSR